MGTSAGIRDAHRGVTLYRAFGLVVASEVPLRLPKAHAERPDLEIRTTADLSSESVENWGSVRAEMGSASVSPAGDRILLAPARSARPAQLQTFLLGMVMVEVLSRRGMLALHGGAVLGPAEALGIVAPSGAGKSTLLAGLMRRGLALLADDMLPLRVAPGEILAVPSFPALRLWDDSLDLFDLMPEVGEPASGYEGKYVISRLECLGSFSAEAAPLRALFLLVDGEAGRRPPRVPERLSRLEAFRSLAESQLGPRSPSSSLRRALFELLGAVASEVPCYAVPVDHSADGLPAMIDKILATSREQG